jgi:hypothetical protein
MTGRPPVAPEVRFWAKVTKTRCCWIWTARRDRHGYGYFGSNSAGKMVRAHRWAWEQEHGPIPEDMTIDHLCNNKSCVRPSHMRVCTAQENQARYYRERTHCSNGHFVPEKDRGNGKNCKTCSAVKSRRWRAQHPGSDSRPNSRYRKAG